MMQTCTVTGGTFGTDVCTDDCAGYLSEDIDDGYTYRYYFLGEYNDGSSGCFERPVNPLPGEAYFPFTPNCLNGCCPIGASCSGFGHKTIGQCSTDADDGTTSSFSAVQIDKIDTHSYCACDESCDCGDDCEEHVVPLEDGEDCNTDGTSHTWSDTLSSAVRTIETNHCASELCGLCRPRVNLVDIHPLTQS
jgi:hypothetical protein